MEMTVEQRRALALANARLRLKQQAPAQPQAKPRTLMDDAYGALVTFNRNFLPGVDEAADGAVRPTPSPRL